MRHEKWNDNPEYFKGTLTEPVCHFIVSVFSDRNYDAVYEGNKDTPLLYHGFTYYLDYKKNDGTKTQIKYIPGYVPNQIKMLSSILDSIIYKSSNLKTDSFALKNYEHILRQLDSSNLPHYVKFKVPN